MILRSTHVRAVILALIVGLLFTTAHADPTFPARTTEPVVDAAGVLSPEQKAALDAKLTDFFKASGQQVVVATIPDLQGYDIADYGYRLGRAWGIGTKERNDGVLLIVAPNERKLRIEVGYGLEPVLTDAYSSVIINSAIVPKFKGGDLPGGIATGVDEIIKQITLPPDQARARAAEAAKAQQSSGTDGWQAVLLFWIVIFFFFILPMMRSFGGRRRRGGSGLGDVILWTAINAAANSGNNSGWGGGGGGSDWGGGGGGFSGGGGSFGGGGASGDW
ncbi:MAG: TPM domain-containing protein [Sphingomonadaceae bacterium]